MFCTVEIRIRYTVLSKIMSTGMTPARGVIPLTLIARVMCEVGKSFLKGRLDISRLQRKNRSNLADLVKRLSIDAHTGALA